MRRAWIIISALITVSSLWAESYHVRLSLEKCMQNLLDANLKIRVEKLGAQANENDAVIAAERFQTAMGAEVRIGEKQQPSDFVFEQTNKVEDKEFDVDLFLSKRWLTGTKSRLEWNRRRDQTNSNVTKINPGYRDELKLELTHPLFQGSGKRIQGAEIVRAKNHHKLSDLSFLMHVEARILQVYRDYWNLVLSQSRYRLMRQEAEVLALKAKRADDELKAGRYTKIEHERDRILYQNHQRDMRAFQNEILKQNEMLRQEIFPERILHSTPVFIEAISRPLYDARDKAKSMSEMLKHARQNRIELHQSALRQANAELDVMLARDKTRLNSEVFGDFSVDGLDRQHRGGFKDITRFEFPDWQIGMRMSFFLKPQSRKARLQKALFQKRREKLDEDRVWLQVKGEVLIATKTREQSAWQIENQMRASDLMGLELQRSKARLDTGRITKLAHDEKRLEVARVDLKLTESLIHHLLAKSQLLVAQGALLKEWVEDRASK